LVPKLADAKGVLAMGWTMRVDKCHDYLMVDISVGQNSTKMTRIRVPNRGDPNVRNPEEPFTWTFRDPVGEEVDLTPWVGDAPVITMSAWVIEDEQTGDHQCDMVVEWDGRVRQRWEFDDRESHTIVRVS
jgi:hypothetical protein